TPTPTTTTTTTTTTAAAAEPESKPAITASTNSLSITVLVQSGVRHSFTLDRAYLERHAIAGTTGDPLDISVWQLKECIWKDWRDDWDQRPASALFIKLIHFGAYMQDSNPLKDCRLNTDSANVIHMAIRPAEAGDDDGTQRSTKGARGGADREGSGGASPGCRCVIL
ncbi:hypothetical protein FN846DRAFT_755686, partial [Sphaerosporella brunnea]